jgi:ribosomal protein S18 acetylase RimI-like enzyme
MRRFFILAKNSGRELFGAWLVGLVRFEGGTNAESLAAVELAWCTAYLGIIPGPELNEIIIRRRTEWWEGAIRKGSQISILAFGGTVAGCTNYGRNRAGSLASDGEIYELYLCPEFQRRGFGRRSFEAVSRDLAQSGLRA